ncbi:hypothetical protein [Paractinoplanes lichenicola]|uniref:Uncharacterized protein n=1 Tax=Paractinoplanes lichenicola TaxID=2802976 RepID=A0ABS1W5V4_9ACTN|nr:hypothetical protein [Actinoplanes lichenicola]MBL7262121.1 hypothetical protein [Actinoplanes lichenicola]
MTAEPSPELDLSVFVLRALDEHLEAVQQIRDRLRLPKSPPGGRRELALQGITLAEQFAVQVGRALSRHPTKHSAHRHGDRSIQSAG